MILNGRRPARTSVLWLCTLLAVWGGSLQQDSPNGGFLPELPLELTLATPGYLKKLPDQNETIFGKQTLTAVFSRPVIALGSDFGIKDLPEDKVPFTLDPPVPGRSRWVTTYIYRFDTEDDWPLDSEITFKWNKNLKTHDGIAFKLDGERDSVVLKTPSLEMDIAEVTSEEAMELTDDEWQADAGLSSDKLPEVPPDGIIRLRFSHPVSTSVVEKSLKVTNRDGSKELELGLTTEECEDPPFVTPVPRCPGGKCQSAEDKKSPENSATLCLFFESDLDVDTWYRMTLPKGLNYSSKAGALKKDVSVDFGGLRRFRVPFQEKFQRISARGLDVWLPHGLEWENDDQLAENQKKFEKQISIIDAKTKEEVDFNVSWSSAGIPKIYALIDPLRKYTVNVTGSDDVKDGFGLPLEDSGITLKASRVEPLFFPMDSVTSARLMIFEAGMDWGKKIALFSQGEIGKAERDRFCGKQLEVNVWSILSRNDWKSAMAMLTESSSKESMAELLKKADRSYIHKSNEMSGSVNEIDVEKMMKLRGAAVFETCSYNRFEAKMMVETDIQAASVISEGMGRMWVTSMKTGKPVRGARVQIYKQLGDRYARSRRLRRQDYELLDTGVTDEKGIVELENYDNGEVVHALIMHKGRFMYLPFLGGGSLPKGRTTVSMVLDRKLVKPKESLHVKGYVLRQDGLEFHPRTFEEAAILVYPTLNATSDCPACEDTFPVNVSSSFGSFEAVIPVPEDATPQNYRFRFRGENADGDTTESVHEDFTVGDPRPPTVDLEVDAPYWVRPNETVAIELSAESFIGSNVGDAEMTLNWEISDSSEEEDPEDWNGDVNVTTDSKGKAEYEIDLGSLSKQPSPGSTLNVDVQWVGPTRELIERDASVRIEAADVSISLTKSITTEIPGQSFGIRSSATTLRGGKLPGGKTKIPIQLKEVGSEQQEEFEETALEAFDGKVVDECTVESGDDEYTCRMKLPSMGFFALEACITVDKETTVCQRNLLGKSEEDWDDRPLIDHMGMEMLRLSGASYKVGDTAKFAVENPFENARALVTWGSSLGEKHKVVTLKDRSMAEFTIDVDENCAAGCGVHVAVSIPRQTKGLAKDLKVPVSLMFDPAAPHFAAFSSDISVSQNQSLPVTVEFPDAPVDEDDTVVAPGSSTLIEVSVDSEDDVEVTVVAVDKAILQLIPYDLQSPGSDFVLDLAASFGHDETGTYVIAPQAIQTLIDAFKARKELDPWAYMDGTLNPTYSSDVDISDEGYLEDNSQDITVMPFGRGFDLLFESETEAYPENAAYSASALGAGSPKLAPDEEATASGGRAFARAELRAPAAPPPSPPAPGAGAAQEVSVRVQKEFVSTALFETTTAEKGVAAVNFTAPDNLGTFVVRAYAATGTGKFGSQEAELIVRRTVSLTPSAPRFARVGDEFEAGAVVTIAGSGTPVEVSISLEGESGNRLQIQGDTSRTVEIDKDGQEEVRFVFLAVQMGEATFKITADAGDGAKDAVVITVPVEGLQEAVSVASSFAVDGNASNSGWQEGLDLPEAVPGSGSIKIQAGVGRMPAVLSLADQIYDTNPEHECPVTADFAFAAVAIPFLTETYKVMELDRIVLDPGVGDVLDGMLSNFTDGLEALQELTDGSDGLQRSTACPDDFFPFTPSFNLYRNARAVWLLKELKEDTKNTKLEGIKGVAVQKLKKMEETWKSALAKGLVEDAESSRWASKSPISTWSAAIARAALGGDWKPPKETSKQIVDDLSMERLSEEFDNMSVASQAYYVLTRLAMKNGKDHPDVKKAVEEWTDNFRVGGRTAYIASAEGSASPASNEANSLILAIFVRTGTSNALVEKLANYVGSPPVGDYGFRLFSLHEKLVAMLSLREYDVSKGSDQPDVELQTRSGDFTLLNFVFNKSTTPVASSSTPWEDLDAPPKPLEFLASGKGEVTIAASLKFVPAKLLPFPTYKGIFVQRMIRIAGEEGESENSPSLAVVPVGSIVEVTTQIMTPDRLGTTTVRVLMPAGLEPVDPNIQGDTSFCPVPFHSLFDRYLYFSCPKQETRPSVVTFTFDSVRPGSHTVSFRAVAATAGKFALPPVRAFVEDQPELMGLSSAGSMQVCSGEGCKPEEEKPPPVPKTCDGDCSGNGACNLESGTCLCFKGFKGDDCSTFAMN